jgi:hypothetical protein
MREVISRATYKRLKGMDRQELNGWLNAFGQEMYNIGCKDAAVAEITSLRDEFSYGTQRIARFMRRRDEIIRAINNREFTIDEAIMVLREEGLRIKTDFEPEVKDANEIDV